jgi:serine/threonine protein kinase
VHGRGIVHRDIRLTNIVEGSNDIILIDWGFATPSGVCAPYRGCLLYASNDILESDSSDIVSEPKHDLYMFVRVLYAWSLRLEDDLKSIYQKEDRQGLLNYWHGTYSLAYWRSLYEFCERLDYDAIAGLLCSFFK